MASRKDSVFGDQAGSVELLWGSRERSSRGPKPGLSRERIARAAIAVADTDGLPAISMQRVASELGFTKMALYRYVPGKAELIAFMIDTAIGEAPVLDSVSGGWRPKLEEWARHMWTMFQGHPWLLGATVGHRVMGPNELGWIECAVGALAGSGLDGGEQMDAVLVVTGHIRNVAQQMVTTAGTKRETTERQLGSAITELLHGRADRYPALTAAVASAASSSSQDKGLEFGLRRIFDGLGLLIAERST